MDTTLIPWDFPGLLAAVFAVAVLIVGCLYALKTWRRTRHRSPQRPRVQIPVSRTQG